MNKIKKIKKILNSHYTIEQATISPLQGGWAALAYVPIIIWLNNNTRLKGKLPIPIFTKKGEYTCEDDEGIYQLFEYIDGETIGEKKLTEGQALELSTIIAELHSHGKEIPIDTTAITEDFQVSFLLQLKSIVGKENADLPQKVRETINAHQQQLFDLIVTVEGLSHQVQESNVKMTLCHTDIHNWNLIQSEQLMLIDWEGIRLAPIEADMMFLVDQPYYDQFQNVYRKYHQNFTINSDALRFYQGRRKLEDIWEYIEQILFDKQNEQERADTIENIIEEIKNISH